jgi:ribosomal protein L11 methyltransferase
MLTPDTMLHIYEIQGDVQREPVDPPHTFIGLWNEEDISYFFFTAPADDFVQGLKTREGINVTGFHEVAYRDWQDGLPPRGLRVGSLYYLPANHPDPPPHAILLDPSVVFGDGTHPTTLACLEALERLCRNTVCARVVDLGTGSGILTLAAARLGATEIVAVDRNRLAVQTAKRNIARNTGLPRISIVLGEARVFLDRPADVVLANLPYQVLRELSTRSELNRHRYWVVSGISAYQGETLSELFADQCFTLEEKNATHPWVTLVFRNR